MKEIIRKEYEASIDELREFFPIGTVCGIDNKIARVIEINEPMAANGMASYPSVTFVVIDPNMSMDVNKLYPTAHLTDCTNRLHPVMHAAGCESQMISTAEAAKRIQEFINSRTVTRDGEKYLPIEEDTIRRLMQDLTKPDAEYYAANDDDFRSRA